MLCLLCASLVEAEPLVTIYMIVRDPPRVKRSREIRLSSTITPLSLSPCAEALRHFVVVSTFCKQAFATLAQWERRN
jgi:hypothetical protein